MSMDQFGSFNFSRGSDINSEANRGSLGKPLDSFNYPDLFDNLNDESGQKVSSSLQNRMTFESNQKVFEVRPSFENRPSGSINFLQMEPFITERPSWNGKEYNEFSQDHERNSLDKILKNIQGKSQRPSVFSQCSQMMIDEMDQQQQQQYYYNQQQQRQSTQLNNSQENGRLSFPVFNFGPDGNRNSVISNQSVKVEEEDNECEEEREEEVKDKPKVGCTCKKSRCLKLYCECFSSGKECEITCRCQDCRNDKIYIEREQAIQIVLMKNAQNENRFNQIIEEEPNSEDFVESQNNYSSQQQQQQQQDANIFSGLGGKKGCNCKKTKCLKKYCECFNSNQQCTSLCKCDNCLNGDYGTFGHLNPENLKRINDRKQVLSEEEMVNLMNKKLKNLSVEEIENLEKKKRSQFIVGRGIVDVWN